MPPLLESNIYCVDASVETNYRKSLLLPSCDSHVKPMGDMLLQKNKQQNKNPQNKTKQNLER